MARHIVIGSNGLVGTALCDELAARREDFVGSSRRPDASFRIDLADPESFCSLRRHVPPRISPVLPPWPWRGIVYLVAAMPRFADCEGNSLSWVVNVDSPIAIAKCVRGMRVVFISSDAVEWCGGTALARQKAQVEAHIQTLPNSLIVRPSRIEWGGARNFARFVIDASIGIRTGVLRWGHGA